MLKDASTCFFDAGKEKAAGAHQASKEAAAGAYHVTHAKIHETTKAIADASAPTADDGSARAVAGSTPGPQRK